MNVDARITSGSNVFFGLAIVSLAYYALFPFSVMWSFLVPAIVFIVPIFRTEYPLLGALLALALAAAFAFFGVAARRRWLTVYVAGIVLYALDGFFVLRAAGGVAGLDIMIGFGFWRS
jgi:hypothetical protein